MTESPRIEALRAMVQRAPTDPRLRFGLANEYEKLGRWGDAAAELTAYLELAEDEGNAWGRLGHALRQLGRDEDARAAYARGSEQARRHGHPTMAADFDALLEDWDEAV
jgi:predicted Zn-dependent protease